MWYVHLDESTIQFYTQNKNSVQVIREPISMALGMHNTHKKTPNDTEKRINFWYAFL